MDIPYRTPALENQLNFKDVNFIILYFINKKL